MGFVSFAVEKPHVSKTTSKISNLKQLDPSIFLKRRKMKIFCLYLAELTGETERQYCWRFNIITKYKKTKKQHIILVEITKNIVYKD